MVITKNSGKDALQYLKSISNKGSRFLEDLIHIMLLAFEGLKSLHINKIIHRDAELKNFVFDKKTRKGVWIDLGYSIIS